MIRPRWSMRKHSVIAPRRWASPDSASTDWHERCRFASGDGGASAAFGATWAHAACITGSKIGAGTAASWGAAAQGSSLAHSVVVAKPDRNSDIVGEAHEPGIILAI